MSAKLMGKACPTSGSYVTLYEVAIGKKAVAMLSVCNVGVVSSKIRVAICPNSYVGGNVPADVDMYEISVLPIGQSIERTAIVLDSGEKVVVWSENGGATFRLHGMEE